jgi:hypothetical protein
LSQPPQGQNDCDNALVASGPASISAASEIERNNLPPQLNSMPETHRTIRIPQLEQRQ